MVLVLEIMIVSPRSSMWVQYSHLCIAARRQPEQREFCVQLALTLGRPWEYLMMPMRPPSRRLTESLPYSESLMLLGSYLAHFQFLGAGPADLMCTASWAHTAWLEALALLHAAITRLCGTAAATLAHSQANLKIAMCAGITQI